MNAGMKLAMVYVAGAMLVAGCGQSNSGSAGTNKSGDSNQSLYDEYHTIICKIKTHTVTASDVARQLEINEQFKKLASNSEHSVKLLRAMDLNTCGSAGTSPSQPATSTQPQSPQKSSENTVDGFKSFKFGMKPSELAKLTECGPLNYGIYSEEKARQFGGFISEENYYKDKLEYRCTADVSGINTLAELAFNDQSKLESVGISHGTFSQEKLDSLMNGLKEKYSLTSTPSDVSIATLNTNIQGSASWFFANNSVELKVHRFFNQLNAIVTFIRVIYHDANSGKEAFKNSQKGNISSGDL